MLVLQRPDGWLCDREALAVWTKRSAETIRRRVPVIEYTTEGRALYHYEYSLLILDGILTRAKVA